MPSASLLRWQTDRIPRLAAVDTHCVATAALAPPNPILAEESLRAYVMLLSGHFHGFCRDLYTECAQVCAAAVPVRLAATVQRQFAASLKLDGSNPTVGTIQKNFKRFAITLNCDAETANALRVTHLGHLNRWRNTVAHQAADAPAGVPPLTLAAVQAGGLPALTWRRGWTVSCMMNCIAFSAPHPGDGNSGVKSDDHKPRCGFLQGGRSGNDPELRHRPRKDR